MLRHLERHDWSYWSIAAWNIIHRHSPTVHITSSKTEKRHTLNCFVHKTQYFWIFKNWNIARFRHQMFVKKCVQIWRANFPIANAVIINLNTLITSYFLKKHISTWWKKQSNRPFQQKQPYYSLLDICMIVSLTEIRWHILLSIPNTQTQI